jgi:hypothetical protein
MNRTPDTATYGQLIVLLRALQRSEPEPQPLPKKVWQDFLRNRKRNGSG